MANKILSVRIGKKYVKICELQYSSNKSSVHVSRILKAQTPEGVVEDGFIMDFHAAEEFLRSVIRENKMTATDVIFSISSNKIATKEIKTPVMKKKQLVQMIEANANEYFPIYLDDYILSHNILDKGNAKTGDKEMRVLVLAAPKDLIDDYFQLADRLKLNVVTIDYAGNSAYQMIRKQINDDATSLVVQIQEETTTVNILKDRVLKLQRTIPYGKNLPIEALAKLRGIDEEEATTLLEQENIIHDSFDGDPVTESLRQIINNVIRVVDYYNSRNADEPVEKAYLVGESVSLKGADFLFATEFDVAVSQIVRFTGVHLDNENETLHRIVTKYVGCLGAGIESVNFMPKDKVDRMKNANSFRFLKIGVLASLVAGVAICAIPVTKLVVETAERDSIQSDIDRIKDIDNVVNDYYKAYDIYTDAKNFKAMTDNNNDSLLGFITDLEENMPSDITIKSVSFSDGEVNISASTSIKDTVASFIQQLEKIDNVSNVFVSGISESKDENDEISATFSLTCTFTKDVDDIEKTEYAISFGDINYDEDLESITGDKPSKTLEDLIKKYISGINDKDVAVDASTNEVEE